jgi:hypothetical protein
LNVMNHMNLTSPIRVICHQDLLARSFVPYFWRQLAGDFNGPESKRTETESQSNFVDDYILAFYSWTVPKM